MRMEKAGKAQKGGTKEACRYRGGAGVGGGTRLEGPRGGKTR